MPISEEAEREEADETIAPTGSSGDLEPDIVVGAPDIPALATFKIKLGQAYYEQGIVNPGAEASRYIGQDGEPVEVVFDNGSEPILSSINRKANPNGSVRLVGRNR